MNYEVVFETKAIDQAAGFLDDPVGLRAVFDAVDRLGLEPRPAGSSFSFGSATVRRLRVGRYRVLYEIKDGVVSVGRIGRRRSAG